jgi:hypothetical protein
MSSALEQKERIFSIIQSSGPSLPVKIASETKLSPLFASAFLSELYGDRRIKISGMRVGGSPLYYIPGQEAMLENFIQHLNQRERDAFLILKDKKVLDDDKQEPVVRVALRAITDFAIPIRIRDENDQKLFWKYHLLTDNEAAQLISVPKSIPIEEPVSEKKKEELAKSAKEEEKEEKPKEEAKVKNMPREPKLLKSTEEEILIGNSVRSYIERKGLVLITVVLEKKKEFRAKVHSTSLFGPQHWYLIAKDKKKLSQTDLKSLVDLAQKEKMPAIFLCPGEPDKKAQEFLNEWSNLVKFEKLVI